jgi:divalent metal cation (Fe/Co/Zn/Cd) transporter
VGRRPPTRRYTYGYGRAEDLAGVVIVTIIAASSALAAYEAVTRLAHPRPVSNLIAVAVAAVIGFTGNEPVAILAVLRQAAREISGPQAMATPIDLAGDHALRQFVPTRLPDRYVSETAT